MGKREDINLDKLAQACERRNVDLHDIIAEALLPEMRADEKSGMNLAKQADLAWKVIDKLEASKKATEITGPNGGAIQVTLGASDADL